MAYDSRSTAQTPRQKAANARILRIISWQDLGSSCGAGRRRTAVRSEGVLDQDRQHLSLERTTLPRDSKRGPKTRQKSRSRATNARSERRNRSQTLENSGGRVNAARVQQRTITLPARHSTPRDSASEVRQDPTGPEGGSVRGRTARQRTRTTACDRIQWIEDRCGSLSLASIHEP